MEVELDSLPALTLDRLLGGRVALRQPRTGYRAAIDPVLLAAAVAPEPGQRLIDLGCGAGAALLCLAARCPQAWIHGLEIDPATAALASANAALNGWQDRIEILAGDLLNPPPALRGAGFDQAFSNPPHLPPQAAAPAPSAAKRRATVAGAGGAGAWIGAALGLLRPKGVLTLVHRADCLAAILAALAPRCGAIVVFPLWPKPGAAAKRVLVRAVKDSRAPLRLSPGLVLHDPAGGYSPAAAAVLAEAAALSL